MASGYLGHQWKLSGAPLALQHSLKPSSGVSLLCYRFLLSVGASLNDRRLKHWTRMPKSSSPAPGRIRTEASDNRDSQCLSLGDDRRSFLPRLSHCTVVIYYLYMTILMFYYGLHSSCCYEPHKMLRSLRWVRVQDANMPKAILRLVYNKLQPQPGGIQVYFL